MITEAMIDLMFEKWLISEFKSQPHESYGRNFLSNRQEFEIGFKAAISLMLPIIKKLQESNEFYADKNNWERINVSQGAFHYQTEWASNLKYADCALFNAGGGRARLAKKFAEEELRKLGGLE